MAAESVVSALSSSPVLLPEAVPELPAAPGFYAWWIRPDAFPEVPLTAAGEGGFSLLYVGIAPVRASSGQSIRSRVVGNHIGGNTGSSTFRLSLAALLFEAKGWQPLARKNKTVLSAADNASLRSWQEEEMALTWIEAAEPWTIEAAVVERLSPPLNLAGNSAHPFHEILSAARRRFKTAAIQA